MPAPTERARRFFGADLARKRAGKKTRTGMSEAKLREFASSVKKRPHGSGLFTDEDMNKGYKKL